MPERIRSSSLLPSASYSRANRKYSESPRLILGEARLHWTPPGPDPTSESGRETAFWAIAPAKYRNEDLAKMGSSFAITDAAGKLFDLKSAEPPKLEILKRGPLYVVLRYTGRLALDTSYSAPFVVTVEMPNSKSWIRVTAKVDDPEKRFREISYRTALSLGPLPWVWDFGTDRWTCGSIRDQSDSVVLTETMNLKTAVSP
jgi:hypothetical protein